MDSSPQPIERARDAAGKALGVSGRSVSRGKKVVDADKRHAVEKLLKLEPEWADNRIAEHVGVSNNFVTELRGELSSDDSCEVDVNPPTRVGSDGKRRRERAG